MYKWLMLSSVVIISMLGLSMGQFPTENLAWAQGVAPQSTASLTITLYLPIISYGSIDSTAMPTITDTPTATPTVTSTATPTRTPIITSTATITPTRTPIITITATITPTTTPIITATATPSATVTATKLPPTITPTATPIAIDCNPSQGSGGLAAGVYSTTVAGLKAVVIVGPNYNPQTPTYLGFFVHGDGGNYYRFTDPNNALRQFVQQHSWILVSPQSPNGSKWWTQYWEANYVPQMRAVMVEMFAKYNLCRNIIFGAGVSGGSEFIANYFFPEAGADYPAHYVLNCGGDVWLSDEEQRIYALGKQPNIVARSSFTFVYGTKDYLYNTILRAIRVYTAANLRVTVDETVGMGHCDTWYAEGHPPADEKNSEYWDKIARELKIYQ